MIGINKFSAECASIDQVSGLLSTSGWDAEFQQLDRGCAPARIRVVGSPRTTLMQIDLASKVYQQGMPGHGTYTFGLPTAPQASGRLGRRILESESLTCFDPVAGMDVVSEAGFSAYTMAFSADRLAELVAMHEVKLMVATPNWPTCWNAPNRSTCSRGLIVSDIPRCRNCGHCANSSRQHYN